MGISYRLKYIAGKVTPGNTVSDIGTDHGFVPLYLIDNNISPHVIAMDKSSDSLDKAREMVSRFGLTEKIECRVSDGFEKLLPSEADTVIISGMGGILTVKILEDAAEKLLTVKELILSPHRDLDLVKQYVEEKGFLIVSDDKVTDKKKEYHVIRALNKNPV